MFGNRFNSYPGIDDEAELAVALMNAIEQDDLDRVQRFLEDEVVNFEDMNRPDWKALERLSWRGQLELVNLLLQHGADVNIKNYHGCTPLYSASEMGHIQVMEVLFQYNADVNIQNDEGWTALHCCSYIGNHQAARLLLEHGADVHIRDNDGETALDRAQWHGHIEVESLLLQYETNCHENKMQQVKQKQQRRNSMGPMEMASDRARRVYLRRHSLGSDESKDSERSDNLFSLRRCISFSEGCKKGKTEPLVPVADLFVSNEEDSQARPTQKASEGRSYAPISDDEAKPLVLMNSANSNCKEKDQDSGTLDGETVDTIRIDSDSYSDSMDGCPYYSEARGQEDSEDSSRSSETKSSQAEEDSEEVSDSFEMDDIENLLQVLHCQPRNCGKLSKKTDTQRQYENFLESLKNDCKKDIEGNSDLLRRQNSRRDDCGVQGDAKSIESAKTNKNAKFTVGINGKQGVCEGYTDLLTMEEEDSKGGGSNSFLATKDNSECFASLEKDESEGDSSGHSILDIEYDDQETNGFSCNLEMDTRAQTVGDFQPKTEEGESAGEFSGSVKTRSWIEGDRDGISKMVTFESEHDNKGLYGSHSNHSDTSREGHSVSSEVSLYLDAETGSEGHFYEDTIQFPDPALILEPFAYN